MNYWVVNQSIYIAVIYCAPIFYVGKENSAQDISQVRVSFSQKELKEWVKAQKKKYRVKRSRVSLIHVDKIQNFKVSESGTHIDIGFYRKGTIRNNYQPIYEFAYLAIPEEAKENVQRIQKDIESRRWKSKPHQSECV